MGDSYKLAKGQIVRKRSTERSMIADKRHRSTSSIVGPPVEGTRSERKLEIRASIPEVEDTFALAEARCNELQEKLEVVKNLKRKRKLRKPSITRVDESPSENIPFISVRAQPKKKVAGQASRLRRLEQPSNPMRGYLDPTTVEQHQMLGQVHGINRTYKQQNLYKEDPHQHRERVLSPTQRFRRTRADGDGAAAASGGKGSTEVACGDDLDCNIGESNMFVKQRRDLSMLLNNKSPAVIVRKVNANRRRHAPAEEPAKRRSQTDQASEGASMCPAPPSPTYRGLSSPNKYRRRKNKPAPGPNSSEERVVELFSKSRTVPFSEVPKQNQEQFKIARSQSQAANFTKFGENRAQEGEVYNDEQDVPEKKTKEQRHIGRVRYRSRRYEMPTVASQMKQSTVRFYNAIANHNSIPFVITKSTAPSHNIGVNIQQVLNGLKIQQPLSGIPLTIAHHMGLGHIPLSESKNVPPMLDNREINVIRLGRRLLRLPSYKYISYDRMLQMYREGDGIVPRFLRSVSRSHCFYSSMYNLANRDEYEGQVNRSRSTQETKQSLAEYASLYRAYEHVDRCLKQSGDRDPELERRRSQLARELAAREDQIRRAVADFRTCAEAEAPPLRATASTAGEGHRYSALTLNMMDG